VGHMETQRQQAIHAAQAKPGNDRGRNQHRAVFAKG